MKSSVELFVSPTYPWHCIGKRNDGTHASKFKASGTGIRVVTGKATFPSRIFRTDIYSQCTLMDNDTMSMDNESKAVALVYNIIEIDLINTFRAVAL